jgi:hypothetical protein
LFARIERDGAHFINHLFAERASEELFLEFKRSANDGQSNRLHDHDREHLKKAIGGFANSEGGVVVWGIDCSKSSNAGDVASSIRPIENPARFVSWLEGAISACTVPPVTGVRSVVIPLGEGTGLAATYVPKSSHAPHQIAGAGKYMIRAGSDFLPAPHGVVAGLFGRPPHPIVYTNFLVSPTKVVDDTVSASLGIMLVNNGQVVAEDLFASLLFPGVPEGREAVLYEPHTSWPATSSVGVDRSFISPREFRLAPGGFISVATIHLRLGRTITKDLRWRLTAGCKGAIPDSQELVVSKDELHVIVDKVRNHSIDMHVATGLLFGIEQE